METLVQLYLDRKIAAAMPFQVALARQMGIGDEAFAGFQQKLLVERNAKMRAAAEPMLEKGGLFIAIGALHLSGPAGDGRAFAQGRLHRHADRIAPYAPRSCHPRVLQGAKGARAPKHCDPVATFRAALRRPRRLLAVPRVRSHRQRAHRSGSRCFGESLSRPGPRAAAPHLHAAPLRDGRPCTVLPPHAQPRSAGPGIRGEQFLASDARDGADTVPQPGHRPCPRKAAQLMRPITGRGCGEYGGGARGGGKFFAWPFRAKSGQPSDLWPRVRLMRRRRLSDVRRHHARRLPLRAAVLVGYLVCGRALTATRFTSSQICCSACMRFAVCDEASPLTRRSVSDEAQVWLRNRSRK